MGLDDHFVRMSRFGHQDAIHPLVGVIRVWNDFVCQKDRELKNNRESQLVEEDLGYRG